MSLDNDETSGKGAVSEGDNFSLSKEDSLGALPPLSDRISYGSSLENELVEKLCEEFQDERIENPRLITFMALVFLRFRHHSFQRAKERMINYLKWREKTFGDLKDHCFSDDDKLREQLESGCFQLSTKKLPNGEGLFFIKMSLNNPSRFNAEETVKCWHFLALSAMMRDPELAANGFVMINDMTNTALANLDSRFPLLMASAVNDSMPVRVTSMILINPPFYIRFVVPLVKSVLSAKLGRRINVVLSQEELPGLLECDIEFIPEQLGGNLPSDNVLTPKRMLAEHSIV